MALQRITHTGAAPPTGLGSPISASALAFTLTSPTGYPTGSGGPFVLDLDAGTPAEEKILCQSLSGSSVTVAPGGRGFDGTSPAAHNAGANNVTHVISSAEADDANAHIYVPTRDDHTQYVRTDGSRSVTGSLTVAGSLAVGGAVSAASVGANTVTAGEVGSGLVRWIGGNTTGPMTGGGPYLAGDFIVTQSAQIWVCTTAGSPGTWTQVGTSGLAAVTRAYQAAGQSIPGATLTLVALDTIYFDTMSAFNTAAHLFTCPKAGIYRSEGSVATASSVSMAAILYHNASPSTYGPGATPNPATGQYTAVVSDVMQCAAGDTLSLYVYAASGIALATNLNFFSVEQVQ